MRDRSGADTVESTDFEESVQWIMKATGLPMEKARLMHLELWTCVHGIGTMLATSFLDLDEDLISRMISDIYQGLLAKHEKTQ
jgi:hypothetical protein